MRRSAAETAQVLKGIFSSAHGKSVVGGHKSDGEQPQPEKIHAAAVSRI